MSLRHFIKFLQAKPYRQRQRVLWLATVVAVAVLFLVWVGSIKMQNASLAGKAASPFGYFSDLFQKAKTQNIQFQDAGPAPTPIAEITLKNFNLDSVSRTLTVNFAVKNTGSDILNFMGPNLKSITLDDGEKKLELLKITTATGGAFPKKILSNTEAEGQMAFPTPQEKIITINIADLSFVRTPDKTFGKTLTLDLNSRDVFELFQSQYPRD